MSAKSDVKTDLKRTLKPFFTAPIGAFQEIDVPDLLYLKIDGVGDPNTSADYQTALSWLYGAAYALKFQYKAQGKPFTVPPLEALWWADDPGSFVDRRKDDWRWTAMLLMPDGVTRSSFDLAIEKLSKKLGLPPASLRIESLEEGPSLQTLHIGSYDTEGAILAQLHDEIMPERGLTFAGPHHEIYLSDVRKTPPEKLRTILRQPVRAR